MFFFQTLIRKLQAVAFVAALLLVPTIVLAATGFDSISFKPATDQGFYLTVNQSQTLGQWGHAFSLLGEFNNDSVVARTGTGVKVNDVVNEEFVLHGTAALGLFNWLNVGLLVEAVPFQDFDAPGTGTPDDGFRMGDIRVDLKARILDNSKHPVGIAIVPFVTLPTGNEQHFVGNGKVTGGGMLVLDSKRIADKFSIGLNVGAQIRSGLQLASGNGVDDQFLMGLGLNYAVARKVQLIGEVNGWTPFNNFMKSNERNLEGNGAVRILPTKHLAVTVGGGAGILDAIGAPDFRAFVGLAYVHPKEEEAPPPPPKEEVIRTNKIHFAYDKATIMPNSYPILDNIVSILNHRDDVEAVRVEGHTDSRGSDAYNLKLSDRRAAAVMDYLVSHGVAREKLTSVGKGESEPIAPNDINGKDNPSGRAENRRVEFHLTVRPGSHLKVVKEQQAPTYPEGSTPAEPKPVHHKKKAQ